ncbi:MAG TPA: hypothetical protein P5181_07275 [Dermatophilaceae bacterium]|nr:hypothetical protein [Dermatophilaceae bacterium]
MPTTIGQRVRPVVVAARYALCDEHRRLRRAAARRLALLGEGSARWAGTVVAIAWLSSVVSLLIGAAAPSILPIVQRHLPWVNGWALLTVLTGATVLAIGAADAKTQERHGPLLRLLDRGPGLAVRLTGLATTLPLVVTTSSQLVRTGECGALPLVSVLAMGCWAIGARGAGHLSARVARRAAISTVVTGLVVGSASMVDGRGSTGSSSALLLSLGLTSGVVLASALVTSATTAHLARRRLAPRRPSAHRSAGIAVAAVLGMGALGASFARSSDSLAGVADHLQIAAGLVAVLLLRATHVHSTSPEALGYGLLLARHTGLSGQCIARHYRVNALALSAPTWAATVILLLAAGRGTVAVLAFGLFVLEVTVDEVIVQRQTAVLPASRTGQLSTASKSGAGAALCLAIIFAAAGAAGLFPTLAFDGHEAQTLAAAGLLTACAGVLAWLADADAQPWLTDLHASHEGAS